MVWHFSHTICLHHTLLSVWPLSSFSWIVTKSYTSASSYVSFFRRLHSVDADTYLSDLKSSQLITNPPDSLNCLLTAYNSTLSSLLDKHASIITKISNRKSKSNPWFSHPLRAFRTTLRHAESIYKCTHSALDTNALILLLTGLNLNLSEIVTIILSLMPKNNIW